MIKAQLSELTHSFSHVKYLCTKERDRIPDGIMSLCLYEGTKAYQQIIMLQFGMETKERYTSTAFCLLEPPRNLFHLSSGEIHKSHCALNMSTQIS